MDKIVLVHGKYFNSWEALGLGYISSYLKKHVPNVEFLFFQGSFDDIQDILKSCIDAQFLLLSCMSPSFQYGVNLAREAKKINPKIKTVFGGYHTSALPHESLVEGVDYVVVGEGESAVLDILNGKPDHIIYARRMSFDELPWPDRDVIKNYRNIKVAFKDNKKNITSFQSHRGCPFHCKYCADGHEKILFRGDGCRSVSRSVDDLLDEMQFVTQKYNLHLLKFCDSTWNLRKGFVKEFCQKKLQRDFNMPFYPNIHANVVDDEMFRLMGDANCYEIGLGVESGSPTILNQIGKGTTLDSIRNAVSLAKRYKIKVRGYFILGMPNESEDDVYMTEKFADELDLDEYGFTILCPYPGTQMYSATNEFKNIDWSNTDEYSNDFWKTKYLDNATLKSWQSRLTQKFKKKITWHNTQIKE